MAPCQKGRRTSSGARVSGLGRHRAWHTARAGPGIALSSQGFGGGLRHRDWSYWVAPLPPAGLVTFVCEWAAAGLGEAQASLGAHLIVEAAGCSVPLWPGHDR